MKRYVTRPVTRPVTAVAAVVCDGCGLTEGESVFSPFHEITIAVSEGEEGGRRDELDLCDPCLVLRAPALVAAGSLAPLVTGQDPPEHD